MRRIFRWFLILFALAFVGAGAALAVFVLRFDPNAYRPLLERKIVESTGIQTSIEDLKLSWQGGFGIEARGLQFQARRGEVPWLSLEGLILRMDPSGILRGQLAFNEFQLIEPRILLIRGRDGSANWEGLLTRSESRDPSSGFASQAVGQLTLLFSTVRIEKGVVTYRDETQTPPLALGLQEVNARIEQVIPGAIIKVSGEAQLLSQTKPDLRWTAEWRFQEQEIKLKVSFEEETIHFEGSLLPLQNPPRFRGNLRINQWDLDSFYGRLGAVGEERILLLGTVNGDLELEGSGSNAREIKQSLLGRGRLEIREGAFKNFNAFREVLTRVTIVPGLGQVLGGSLPQAYQPLFQQPDTPFEAIQTEVTVQGGQVGIKEFILKNPHYLVEAAGTVGLDRFVNLRARLILFEELTGFLVRKVEELSYLMNVQKRIVIPFVYRGIYPQAYPQPDLAYLGRRVVVDQGAQLLQKGLEALGWVDPQKGEPE